MLPDFLFCSLFPVQQTTSGIGHRVKEFFGLATNTLNVRNNNVSPHNRGMLRRSRCVLIFFKQHQLACCKFEVLHIYDL